MNCQIDSAILIHRPLRHLKIFMDAVKIMRQHLNATIFSVNVEEFPKILAYKFEKNIFWSRLD